ncbi:hypothetical protein EW145_g3278 [Phellinidium pouzarii]|uniref:DUF6699 domain-containing protein n=1 Tax=Phellinidium pouzarii TaxID=167371 RepID=A0A4V3XCX2_9AGAM|nr:hypothetical protein EW145_g3278 [Phellinidium pouzarii]
MQLHSSLDPSLLGSLKRNLSRKGRCSYVDLDMSARIDWLAKTDAFLDEPATSPPRTTLYIECAGLAEVCVNHGERQFRIVRTEAITVRDVLVELDRYLHRRAPVLSFKAVHPGRVTSAKERRLSGGSSSDEGSLRRRSVEIEVPAQSEESLSSGSDADPAVSTDDVNHYSVEASEESLMSKWLGEKTTFSGLKCAENHDFKLIVRMVKPLKYHSRTRTA